MKSSSRKLSLPASIAGAVFVALGALSALAQETSKAPDAPAAGSEDMVVALEKFEVNGEQMSASAPMIASTRLALTVRETPQSISTIGRIRLDQESIFSVNDALQNVTGVHVSF